MLHEYIRKLRLISRDARLLLAVSALSGLTVWGGIYSVLLNLYLLRLGYGTRFIGLVNSVGLLSVGVLSLPAGIISVRLGTRRMLIAGVGVSAVGFAALPLVEFAPAGIRAPLILITYLVGYIGMTLWAVNTSPCLAAATSEQERSYAFSVRMGLTSLAAFVGSLIAGFLPGLAAILLNRSLDDPAPYRYTLLLAGALVFLGVPALAATSQSVIEPPSQTTEDSGKAPWTPILVISLVVLLTVFGEGAVRTFYNVYLDTELAISTAQIGTISAIAQLLALPAALITPLLADRLGLAKATQIGNVATALCLLPVALWPARLAAAGGVIGTLACANLARTAITTLQQECVEPRWRSTMSGATTTTAGLGFAAAAFGGGYLVPAMGYRGLFLVGAAISFAGILVFWGYLRKGTARA